MIILFWSKHNLCFVIISLFPVTEEVQPSCLSSRDQCCICTFLMFFLYFASLTDLTKKMFCALLHFVLLVHIMRFYYPEVSSSSCSWHPGSGLLCTFKDKTYSPGDSWHPYLEPFGFMFCMRCVCTEVSNDLNTLYPSHNKLLVNFYCTKDCL